MRNTSWIDWLGRFLDRSRSMAMKWRAFVADPDRWRRTKVRDDRYK